MDKEAGVDATIEENEEVRVEVEELDGLDEEFGEAILEKDRPEEVPGERGKGLFEVGEEEGPPDKEEEAT